MNKFVDSGFDTKFGLAYVPGMGKKIKITILASGFGLGTRPYVSDSMGNANSGVVSINDDVDNRAKEEERIRRREKFYGNKVNKQKRPHFIYKFSDADLDNEDVIKMVSESNTQTRRYETLKRIQQAGSQTIIPSRRRLKIFLPKKNRQRAKFISATDKY